MSDSKNKDVTGHVVVKLDESAVLNMLEDALLAKFPRYRFDSCQTEGTIEVVFEFIEDIEWELKDEKGGDDDEDGKGTP